MSDNKQERMTYEKERRKVKISGNSRDVKWVIWIEQLRPVIMVLLLLLLIALGVLKIEQLGGLWKFFAHIGF